MKKNYYIKHGKSDREVYWSGSEWTEKRSLRRLYGLSEASEITQRMGKDGIYAVLEVVR